MYLAYTPTNSVPQTFFGANFFLFDTSLNILRIANNFWIFLVSWLPLTVFTIALYFTIVWYKKHDATKNRVIDVEKD